jgi:hypothetical protein
VGTETSEPDDLLARADAERVAGRGEAAARLFDEAAVAARARDDIASWASAALGAASVQAFGTEPGRVPAQLYDVLARTTDEATRARLGAALARCWVYAGEARRAGRFSDDAVASARRADDPAVLADALDAALAAHWGPDELEVRRALARELDDVAAHVLDPDTRLQAHLWGLQVGCETLDLAAMNRQIRALERLGEDSPRALFFASTRRAMLDLLRGRPDTTPQLLAVAAEASERCHIPDAFMVISCVRAYAAIQDGAVDEIVAMAARAEEFAQAEGNLTVVAESAYCFAAAGEPERARRGLLAFDGDVLDEVPRDVDWLLVMQLCLEVALATGEDAAVARLADLLAPYAGRSVVNAGAVMFHGTTDDTLSRAFARLGRDEEAARLRARALRTYERLGAQWWRRRLEGAADAPVGTFGGSPRTHLRPTGSGLWEIGRDAVPSAGLRGYGYLRDLVRRPGEHLSSLDLVGARGTVVEESGLGEVVDQQALAAYRARLEDLTEELAEAEDWADAGRVEKARAERDALLDEVRRATGLGGRTRVTGSSQERARSAVKKALSAAIERIDAVDPALAAHLRNSIRTGLECSYVPEPGSAPDWVLD